MKLSRTALCLVAFAGLTICSRIAEAQSAAGAGASSSASSSTAVQAQPGVAYTRPTEKQKIVNFAFDAFGPYPFIGAAAVGGIQQGYDTPPEWGQGMDAYGVRVASVYGISLTTTVTRYALAEAFREDTIYYPCECSGIFPRMEHALISTVTSRRGEDGHRMISFPAIAAPYAGSMTAALGWYPSRYEPMDGFRMGNYNLLGQAAQNLATEFVYGGPHSLLSHHSMGGLIPHRRTGQNP